MCHGATGHGATAYANPKPEQVPGGRQAGCRVLWFPAVVPCRRVVRESNLESILGRSRSKRCTKIRVRLGLCLPWRPYAYTAGPEGPGPAWGAGPTGPADGCGDRGRRRLPESVFGSIRQECEGPAGCRILSGRRSAGRFQWCLQVLAVVAGKVGKAPSVQAASAGSGCREGG